MKRIEYIRIENPSEKLLKIAQEMKKRKEKRREDIKKQTFKDFIRI